MARRGTTPDYIFSVHGYDLTSQTVYLTLRQGRRTCLTLTNDRLDMEYDEENQLTRLLVHLSQEETLRFGNGFVEVQARFIDSNNNAKATYIKSISFQPILKEGVIEYADG